MTESDSKVIESDLKVIENLTDLCTYEQAKATPVKKVAAE